jgi:hypothetical protein
MKRSIVRAYLGSSFLVAVSSLVLLVGCDDDSSEVASDHDASAGDATSGGSAAGGHDAAGGTKAGASAGSNGDGSPDPGDNEAGASASGGHPGADAAGGAGTDDGTGAVAGAGGEPACVPEPPALPTDVPAAIVVSETATLLRSLHAVGTQNYRCTQTAGAADAEPTFTWVFVAPVADLFNSCGTKVGSHFAVADSNPPAPEWKYEIDGSSVLGLRVSGAPVVGSIPELLLKENGHSGAGVFAGVTFVQRLQTLGGLAPDVAECTAENLGDITKVAYSAQYYFYSGGA